MHNLTLTEPPASAYYIVRSDNGIQDAILASSADEAIGAANEDLRIMGIHWVQAVSARQATDIDFDE